MSLLIDMANGGLIGVIGSLATNTLGIFKAKQEHQQTIDIKKIEIKAEDIRAQRDIEAMRLEAETEGLRLANDREINLSEDDLEAYRASIKANQETTYTGENRWLIFAEFWRKITRPSVTHYLILNVTVMYYVTDDLALKRLILEMVLAATGMVLGWWFSDRTFGKRIATKIWN